MHWFNTQDHWGLITIVIHWLSALMIFGLFGLGLWMVELNYYDAWYHKAPDLHKSIGIVLLIVTLLRLILRCIQNKPKALTSHTPRERKIATTLQYSLYSLLIMIMLNGYLISTADARAITVFNWFQVPAIPTLAFL